LDALVAGIADESHPRDLSEGQRLALVLAIQLTATPRVILLDEPTRGLDYAAKRHLAVILRELAGAGHAVLLSTHDVEFVASVADRVLVMADGDVVADGSARDILVASPAFAPQVARILAPGPWLTVDDVALALAAPPTVGVSVEVPA
jgi:energy-coupling factor transport system ATP-binding protein